MTRNNCLKTVMALIENEISVSGEKIKIEADTGHFGKACGWQKYQEGLEAALGFVRVVGNKKES